MLEILSADWFRYGVLPLLSASIGIFLKILSRNDAYETVKKEDFAIGIPIMLSSILAYLVVIIQQVKTYRQFSLINFDSKFSEYMKQFDFFKSLDANVITEQLANAGWIVFLLFLIVVSVATLVRKFGWERDENNASNAKIKLFVGVIFPNIVGILQLYFIVTLVGQK